MVIFHNYVSLPEGMCAQYDIYIIYMSSLHYVAFFPQCLQTVSLHKLVAEKCSCHMPSCRIAKGTAAVPVITRGDCKHCASLIELKDIEHDRFQRKHIISLKPGGCPCDSFYTIPSFPAQVHVRYCFFLLMLQEGEHPHPDFYSCVWHRSLSLCQQIAHQEGACGYRWVLYSAKNRLTVSSRQLAAPSAHGGTYKFGAHTEEIIKPVNCSPAWDDDGRCWENGMAGWIWGCDMSFNTHVRITVYQFVKHPVCDAGPYFLKGSCIYIYTVHAISKSREYMNGASSP